MVTKASKKRPTSAEKDEARNAREARLAEALRANLKRRKQQARARKGLGDQNV